jgi:LCP family protein required for cell wall assembly
MPGLNGAPSADRGMPGPNGAPADRGKSGPNGAPPIDRGMPGTNGKPPAERGMAGLNGAPPADRGMPGTNGKPLPERGPGPHGPSTPGRGFPGANGKPLAQRGMPGPDGPAPDERGTPIGGPGGNERARKGPGDRGMPPAMDRGKGRAGERTTLAPAVGGLDLPNGLPGSERPATGPNGDRTQLTPSLNGKPSDRPGPNGSPIERGLNGSPADRPGSNGKPADRPGPNGKNADRTQLTSPVNPADRPAPNGNNNGSSPADRTQLTSAVNPAEAAGDGNGRPRSRRAPMRPKNGVPPRSELDPLTMTDEMEAIDEATQSRRKIDHTLARFSAAHDEMAAEEAKRRERREWLTARPVALLEQTRTALQRVVMPGDKPESAEADAANEAEKAPQTRLQEKKQRHNDRAMRIGRISLIVLASLVFLATGGAWGAVNWFDAKFTQVAALDENSSDIQNAAAQANDENFLMVGSDSRDGASAEENVGSADNVPGARSDTVMVAHVPADRKRVVVVSFPRDLEINRPDCNRWDPAKSATTDEVVKGQPIAKLNTAFGVGGPQCMTKVIQKLTGLRINHFVGIDFNGFKAMVDAVHGVTVNNPAPIDDTVLGKVLLETGNVTISGDQALSYVRARHVKGDPTSDYGRIKRQQEFIGALLKKVMSSDVVLDPSKLSSFITAFAGATFGDNLGVQQMMTLAQSMRGLDPSKINFMTVPTTGTANKRGNEVLIQSKTDDLFTALRDNTPLPGDKPVGPSQTAAEAGSANSSQTSSNGSSAGDAKKAGNSG